MRRKPNQFGITGLEILLALGAIAVVTPAVVGGISTYQDNRDYNDAIERRISAEEKTELRGHLSAMLSTYPAAEHCFARVSSLGDRTKFLNAFDDAPVVVDAEKSEGAIALYQSGVVHLSDDVSALATNQNRLRVTIWHEMAHHFEVENGDRRSLAVLRGAETWKSRGERHTEYMEDMIPIMERLRIFERAVREDKPVETLRAMWNNIERTFASGSRNDYEPIPSDLDEFSQYTGFDFDLDTIKQSYMNEACLDVPDGVFNDIEEEEEVVEEGGIDVDPADLVVEVEPEEYVVWEALNTTIGLAITTRERFNTDELARGYSGGGIDNELIVQKELFIDQSFESFEEAEEHMCGILDDVRVWPLGAGLHGKLNGEAYHLSNFGCASY